MTPKDGEQTKQRILQKAEELFFEKGFDATSVDSIAKAAGVNKALIYYYFDAKGDLLAALFDRVMQDLAQHREDLPKHQEANKSQAAFGDKIRAEIEFLGQHRRILALMMMEAFKGQGQDSYLFKCAEMVMSQEHQGQFYGPDSKTQKDSKEHTLYLVHEFYTGLMPVIAFVVMQDQWCRFFKCEPAEAREMFVEAFVRSHFESHLS